MTEDDNEAQKREMLEAQLKLTQDLYRQKGERHQQEIYEMKEAHKQYVWALIGVLMLFVILPLISLID